MIKLISLKRKAGAYNSRQTWNHNEYFRRVCARLRGGAGCVRGRSIVLFVSGLVSATIKYLGLVLNRRLMLLHSEIYDH